MANTVVRSTAVNRARATATLSVSIKARANTNACVRRDTWLPVTSAKRSMNVPLTIRVHDTPSVSRPARVPVDVNARLVTPVQAKTVNPSICVRKVHAVPTVNVTPPVRVHMSAPVRRDTVRTDSSAYRLMPVRVIRVHAMPNAQPPVRVRTRVPAITVSMVTVKTVLLSMHASPLRVVMDHVNAPDPPNLCATAILVMPTRRVTPLAV